MAVMADGSTAWQDGALIQAVKRPGTIIVLDELTIAPAGVQAVIQLISDDHRSITLPTGEVVICAPGVVFVVADNTRGYGDQSGIYHGTNPSNGALVNRFGRMIVIDYMSAADEARALVNHTGCPMPAAKSFAAFIARARKLPEMENAVLSLRQMVAFIHEIDDGFAPEIAAETVFLSRLVPEERAALQTMFTLTWGQEFAGLMSGSPADGKVASPATPKTDSPAGRAFDDDTTASLNR
jgi:cobaltochelatase CobS